MKFKALASVAAVGLVSLLGAKPAESDEILFDQGFGGFAGGFIYWTGNAADGLVGSQIQFMNIEGVGTPLKDGVALTCVGCYLNFETGAYQSDVGGIVYTFNAGGTFQLEGDIAPSLLEGFGGYSGTIVDGTFLANPTKPLSVSVSGGTFTGFGEDVKPEDLTNFYGTGPDFRFTNTTIYGTKVGNLSPGVIDLYNLDPACTDTDPSTVCRYTPGGSTFTLQDGGFVIRVSTGDIRNTPIPEPASGLLLLLGLSALAVRRRRA